MKTILTSLFVAAAFTVTSFSGALADNGPARKPAQVAAYQSGMYTTAEGKLNIALDKQTGGALDVRLLDQSGKAIYNQYIGKRETTVRMRLDLSNLPDGAYQVVISNGKDVTTHAVTIATKPVATSARLVALN
jgi:hypothetical protein